MTEMASVSAPASERATPAVERLAANSGAQEPIVKERDGAGGRAPVTTDEVVVLDYGGQYSQLIARRVRECGVFSELVPHHVALERVAARKPRGIILSGGPASVYAPDAPPLQRELLELGVPVLGICYGMQLLVHELGGRVEQADVGEFGRSDLTVTEPGRLLAGLPREQTCWMSHRDTVFAPPPGFTALASSSASPVAAVEDAQRRIYGIQFHPEVVHTPYGQEILTRFLTDICGCEATWSAASIVEDQIARIRRQVGDGRVICGLSGGVDSSVAALLVHRAIGDQLTCVFVDHGLMRKDEGEQVISAFRDTFKVPLVAVDAEQRFLEKLRGVTEPEAKRKAIGAEFIRVFEEEAAKLAGEEPNARAREGRGVHGVDVPAARAGEGGDVDGVGGGGDVRGVGGDVDGVDAEAPPRAHAGARFLVQGTLYSDVIESGGGTGAATIKSHHNVGGLPDDLQFELVEPLRALFKDEVRAVGAELGLPERLVWRQPFPGPGLAIRVVGGEATKERLDVLREADHILQEEIRKAGLYRELWQSFCVLPDIRTVGVQGDERTYGYVVVIRAVTSDDAMTADWARLPYDLLETIASRMIGELREVNRVVLDITSKPPGTIEWE
jgi:GMP synthase (glutamine-hydrolysing)